MIKISQDDLRKMLIEAGEIASRKVVDELVAYSLRDAAAQIGISYVTLQRRIANGKINCVDGRISGAEIRRYLSKQSSNT